MNNLPKFKIGDLEMSLIQGGMGIGVSSRKLASAVANCGGAGIISAVELGQLREFPGMKSIDANRQALSDEIKATRELSKNGVIGVNIMYALTDYHGLVETAAKENVDMIISGAGLAKDLPEIVGNSPIKLIPIVSDVRAAKVLTKLWGRYGKVPDAFIVEGPKAGGHLGFKYEDLKNGTAHTLENIASEVIDFANDKNNFDSKIPVIVAGGIYTGQDIRRFQNLGAAGVQMGTRFVTTYECDASNDFKKTYLDASKEDIVLIKSPVGLPGRAIKNSFLEKVGRGEEIDFKCKYNCLKTCVPKDSPYCIANALLGAQQGNFNEGFAFAGTNAYRATEKTCLDENGEFITVKTLMDRLSKEYHSR